MRQAIIIEQGNGYPDVGAYVSGAGELYRVMTIETHIHTGDSRGNYVYATVEPASWSDCPEGAEHSARVAPAARFRGARGHDRTPVRVSRC